MRQYTNLEKMKKFDVRVEFKNSDDIKNIQMLIYLNDELAYATRKNSFFIKEYDDVKITLNKWYIPKCIPTRFSRLAWDDKSYVRYSNFIKSFRVCRKIDEVVLEEMNKFTKVIEKEEVKTA